MVGISGEDPVLAGVDQIDLLGLQTSDRTRSINWLRARAKKIQILLHPDRLILLPPNATLPYDSVQANAVAGFLKDAFADEELILSVFWRNAVRGHRRRWQPFDDQERLRDVRSLISLPAEIPKPSDHAATHASDAYWTGERERRPYAAAHTPQTSTAGAQNNDAGCDKGNKHCAEDTSEQAANDANDGVDEEKDNDMPSAAEPLTAIEETIRRVASSFPLGKLFTLAADPKGRRFVFARTRLRKKNGKNQWALVSIAIAKNERMVLMLCKFDINSKGVRVKQDLRGAHRTSWDRMDAAGWYGLGRFCGATREQIREFALMQMRDHGSSRGSL